MKRNPMNQFMYTAAVTAMFIAGTPLGALESDQTIDASLKQTYVYRTYLKDDNINVTTEDGVVTLTGTVADKSNRVLAQDTAECVPGVIRVDNQLETKDEVDASRADAWVSRKVKLALLFYRNVSVASTTVKVKDGVVTLSGEATSEAQKDLTAQYAGDIEGVVEVKNLMTVAESPAPEERTEGEKIDDASVTALVRSALLIHRSTRAVNTKVVARNGVVMLTGIAENEAEKTLVTKLAGNIQGVTSVQNQMTVKNIIKN